MWRNLLHTDLVRSCWRVFLTNQQENNRPERNCRCGRSGRVFRVVDEIHFVVRFFEAAREGAVGEEAEVGFGNDGAVGEAFGAVAEGSPDADGQQDSDKDDDAAGAGTHAANLGQGSGGVTWLFVPVDCEP